MRALPGRLGHHVLLTIMKSASARTTTVIAYRDGETPPRLPQELIEVVTLGRTVSVRGFSQTPVGATSSRQVGINKLDPFRDPRMSVIAGTVEENQSGRRVPICSTTVPATGLKRPVSHSRIVTTTVLE
jgi:hypothetical protein